MTRACLAMLLLAGCSSTLDSDDYPVDPGGGGGGGRPRDAGVDGSGDAGDASTTIAGRVCAVVDLRNLTSCATTGVGGLTVTLGNRTASTADNGDFTITMPTGTNLTWRVTGNNFVTSVMELGGAPSIPTIDTVTYTELQTANGVIPQAAQGAIVARIVKANLPVTGTVAMASPTPQYATRYDGSSAAVWDEDATSTAGTAWFNGVPVGASMITVSAPNEPTIVKSIVVADQSISYA
ncbi:MAG: hypothetical protein M3619_19710, partial [Myxococcota bacterium]|nr:hypothetical protein [Myxococcota bacterium]